MKYLGILFITLVVNVLNAQVETDILNPRFSKLEGSLNDTTLIDVVKYGGNTIYYEFQNKDTISEFFLVSDSIYKYRQKIASKVSEFGYYVFHPVDTISSLHNPPGQYEEEIRNHISGNLLKTGAWQNFNKKLTGHYYKDKKIGIWKQRTEDATIEYSYEEGQLQSILNPTRRSLMENAHWFNNQDLRICSEELFNLLEIDRVEIVKKGCSCYTDNTSPKIILTAESIKNRDSIKYKWTPKGNLILIQDSQEIEFSIWRYGMDRVNMKKVKTSN